MEEGRRIQLEGFGEVSFQIRTNLLTFQIRHVDRAKSLLCLEVANSTNLVLMAWTCHKNWNVENQINGFSIG